MFSLDDLTSTQFEEFCFDLLASIGFVNIDWRKGTGLDSSPSDSGRDIECQYQKSDVDGHVQLEQWFVECKHYKKGVPPDRLQGALAWAESTNVDTLLIVASNFLSNGAKDFLRQYETNRKPPFRIRTWERPDLERLTAGRSQILRKYNLVGEFPFLRIIHPAHALYMKGSQLNTLDYLFSVLDQVEPEKRDGILSWISIFLVKSRIKGFETMTVFGRTVTLPLRDKESLRYEAFKDRCYELAVTLDEPLLVFLIVNWVLQAQLQIGDVTSVDEFIKRQREHLEFTNGEFMKFVLTDEDREAAETIKKTLRMSIENASENAQNNYDSYVWFCEQVVAPLLKEAFYKMFRDSVPAE